MKKLFIAMLLPALLAGCSSDNITSPAIDNNQDEQGEPILFCSGLNQTKAVIEGTVLPTNAEIGIYGLIAEKESSYSGTWNYTAQDYLSNGKYIALEAANNIQQLKADHIAKFPEDKALIFFAYYPYNASENNGSITVTIDPTIDNTPDYLYTGDGTSTKATPLQRNAVNLQFKHAMARLDIKVKKGDDAKLPATATLKKIQVAFDGGIAGTMSLADGTITATIANDQTVTSGNLTINIDDASKTTPIDTKCKFLLFPSNVITKIILTLTRSDAEGSGELEYTITANTNDIKLEAGKITTLTLTYLPNDALFTSNVTEWDTTGTNDKDFDAN